MSGSNCPRCGAWRHPNEVAEGQLNGVCVTCWVEDMDKREGIVHRYFVVDGGLERETDEAGFVEVERRAGFHNTLGRDDKPGTAGFIGADGLRGRIETVYPPTKESPSAAAQRADATEGDGRG